MIDPPAPFPDFYGNLGAASTLAHMIDEGRLAQTILLSGPEGVGKATLARRFAARLVGGAELIERDDLSRPENQEAIEAREKWTADKRNEDPLLFSSRPDFVTYPPDGPLRQITIPQMRHLREQAQLKPVRGDHRVFLIDHLDRANEQAANSLLKVLEEPPPHLVIFATVENLYDLLPTIRSRSVVLRLSRLSDEEMTLFLKARGLSDSDLRASLAEGSPGLAVTLDIEQLQKRRAVMLTAFECGAGVAPFSTWVAQSETFGASKSEKLELYLRLGYGLLRDLLALTQGAAPAQNRDIAPRLRTLAERIDVNWITRASAQLDELVLMARRNIQKTAALDAVIMNLRNSHR